MFRGIPVASHWFSRNRIQTEILKFCVPGTGAHQECFSGGWEKGGGGVERKVMFKLGLFLNISYKKLCHTCGTNIRNIT